MDGPGTKVKRRKTPWVIGTLMVASLALLVILQSTNLWKTFTIESSSDLLQLYALSTLNFIAFIIFGFIFLRSIIRLVRERRTFEYGAQIKTRLLIYFVAVSILPIIAMAVFSYLFLNRALERWFSSIPENIVRQTREMQRSAIDDRAAKLESSTRMLAATLSEARVDDRDMARIAEAGNLSYIAVVGADNSIIAHSERGVTDEQRPELAKVLETAMIGRTNEPALSDGVGFDVGAAQLGRGRRLIIVPDPVKETNVSQIVDSSLREFESLRDKQLTVRRLGLLVLGVLTFLLLFAASWIAFYLARGLTGPIKALAEGAGEIATGNLGYRVEVLAEDELAILVNAFNEMASQLEASSIELAERRRYIETVLETLPTGVISIDADDKVGTINQAALVMFGLEDKPGVASLTDVVSGEEQRVIAQLVARARRVGHSSDQTLIKSIVNGSSVERTVAVTASALPEDNGVVLVFEDLSELQAAQRAHAWQEVARRMAHEIKNPLTPIQLSAERIAKRFTQTGHVETPSGKRITDQGPIAEVVHESTDTILREVASLKTMVDEFSRFARLPDTKLEPGDLKDVIRQAVGNFDGRFPGVDISFNENGALPELLLDAEQLKRVFINLIGNSVEAFDPAHEEKSVTITARHDAARDIVVAEVTDTGKGIAGADLQKLFLPYFTTKGRGTGLGLSIVKRIVSDHHGRINVVANQPRGAKFILELPVS